MSLNSFLRLATSLLSSLLARRFLGRGSSWDRDRLLRRPSRERERGFRRLSRERERLLSCLGERVERLREISGRPSSRG